MKHVIFLMVAILLASGCSGKKKGALGGGTGETKPTEVPPEKKDSDSNETPKSPTVDEKTVIEGKWVSGCEYNSQEELYFVATITVDKNVLTYEEEHYTATPCVPASSYDSNYSFSAYFVIEETTIDDFMTHQVTYIQEDGEFGHEWLLDLREGSFHSSGGVTYDKK